jgi:predicted CoA-binding protein
LVEHGYTVIQVNPTTTEALGRKSYPVVSKIPNDLNIDIVDIPRKSEDASGVAEDAIKKKGIKLI